MQTMSDALVFNFADSVLQNLEKSLTDCPEWVKERKYNAATVNNTILFVFGSHFNNTVQQRNADLSFLIDVPDFEPRKSKHSLPREATDPWLVVPKGYDTNNRCLQIEGRHASLFNCGIDGHHRPAVVFETTVQQVVNENITKSQYITLALYVHVEDLANPVKFWQGFGSEFVNLWLEPDGGVEAE